MQTLTLPAGTVLYRVHRRINGPIFFDSSAYGRFNPVKHASLGACYFAFDPLGAFVEVFRQRYIRKSDIDDRFITTCLTVRDLVLFDATGRSNRFLEIDGREIDVTLEISAGNHDRAQKLASLLADQTDGVHYLVRHDPNGQLRALAAFGPAGPCDSDALFAGAGTEDIDDAIVQDACKNFGYEVFDDTPVLR